MTEQGIGGVPLKLKLTGELRGPDAKTLDEIADHMRSIGLTRSGIDQVSVLIDADVAMVKMTIEAESWAQASEVGAEVFRSAVDAAGYELVEDVDDDDPPLRPRSVERQSTTLAMA